MEKTSFELKAGLNAWYTGGAEGREIRLEPGAVYTTSDGTEISVLRQHSGEGGPLKEVDVPEGARAGSKTATDDPKKAAK